MALAGCATSGSPGSPTTAGGSSAASTPSPKGAGADEMTSIPKDCLDASEVSALVAFTVATPIVSSDADTLSCTYIAGSDYSKTIEINFQMAPAGTTSASLQAQLKSSAAANASIAPVPGFGRAAFASSDSTGAGILVWSGDIEFNVSGQTTLQGVELVAKDVLAG